MVQTYLINLIPFKNAQVKQWGTQARLLHWLTCLWLFIGLVTLCSASFAEADYQHQNGLYYLLRQLAWCYVGGICFNILVCTPIRQITKLAVWGFFIMLALIFATLIPNVGININGATRWLSIGPLLIQPSELIKPFLIVQSALLFGRWPMINWKKRLGWLLIFCFLLVAILMQPNLSTTALCGMALWLMALGSGLRWSYLAGSAITGLMAAIISTTIHDYQRRRITSFLQPWADSQGDGYQLTQSLMAIGSGGIWGTGLGLSQQKLFYLPIQYTDFIFAIFAEEFGFVGSILLLILLSSYGFLAFKVASRCDDQVKSLIAVGAMIFLVGQSLLNIGVATGVLPTTGLPFPLFSYGGSSMISSLCLAGLLIRVARESSQAKIIRLN